MSARELVVFGTSSQVPTRFRNHNGYLLRLDEGGFLFDPGEGTQRQMALVDVTATEFTRIFISHFHGDHCLGFAGISQRISLERVPHPVHVHFPNSGRIFYDRLTQASIYERAATLVPEPIASGGVILDNGKLKVTARVLDHRAVDTFGYRLEEYDATTVSPEKLKEAGVVGNAVKELQAQGEVALEDGRIIRLEDVSAPKKGQSFAFVMDTRVCRNAYELARGVDMLVCESTYLSSERREAKARGHMTARQAAIVARDAGAKFLVLTHFSQRHPSNKPFVREAKEVFENVVAAKDATRIPMPRRTESTQ